MESKTRVFCSMDVQESHLRLRSCHPDTWTASSTDVRPSASTVLEMEFSDINMKKDSSLLFHAIHSLSTGGFIKENHTLLCMVLKIHTKKSAKQENSSLFVNRILQKGKERVENQTKLESEKSQSYAQKPRVKIPFKNSISGLVPGPIVQGLIHIAPCTLYSKKRVETNHEQDRFQKDLVNQRTQKALNSSALIRHS